MNVADVVIGRWVSNEPRHTDKQRERHDRHEDPELNRPVAA
jgi:hypothetical protein